MNAVIKCVYIIVYYLYYGSEKNECIYRKMGS